MEINLTLLVQAIHFLGAYVLLRTFLFNPVLRIIHQEKRAQQHLEDTIQSCQETIDHKKKMQVESWQRCLQLFYKVSPSLLPTSTAPLDKDKVISVTTDFSSELIMRSVTELKDEIIKQVRK